MTKPLFDIHKLQKGDQKAFRSFFEAFYPKLMALACRFVETQIARDLVQDVFLTYWEQRLTVQIENLQAYLYKSLKNKCLDYLRHQEVVEDYEARIRIAEARVDFINNTTDTNDVFAGVSSRNIYDLIEQSVKKLPPKCEQAFRLCYFHDIPQKEVAEIMNLSVRTVERHVRRAVLFLRSDLDKILIFIFMFFSIN